MTFSKAFGYRGSWGGTSPCPRVEDEDPLLVGCLFESAHQKGCFPPGSHFRKSSETRAILSQIEAQKENPVRHVNCLAVRVEDDQCLGVDRPGRLGLDRSRSSVEGVGHRFVIPDPVHGEPPERRMGFYMRPHMSLMRLGMGSFLSYNSGHGHWDFN